MCNASVQALLIPPLVNSQLQSVSGFGLKIAWLVIFRPFYTKEVAVILESYYFKMKVLAFHKRVILKIETLSCGTLTLDNLAASVFFCTSHLQLAE